VVLPFEREIVDLPFPRVVVPFEREVVDLAFPRVVVPFARVGVGSSVSAFCSLRMSVESARFSLPISRR
jgi:hypothetical protein